MFYVYLVLSAVLIPVSDIFFAVLRESYSWWLIPLLFVGFFIGLVILHLAVFALSVAFVNVNSPAERGAKYYRFAVNITIPLLLKLCRVKVNASGVEKLPENTRFLLVCNHQHDFDPIMIMSVLPNAELGFIGKKEIYKTMPFIGKIMHKLYCLPIDRENNREAAKTIISASRLLKEDKASIGLFPEGYTSKTCELLPLRNGAFKIAYKAHAPIAVCVINNTRAIPRRVIIKKTDIEFRVLDVINPEQFESLHTNELGEIVYNEMNNALKDIRKEC